MTNNRAIWLSFLFAADIVPEPQAWVFEEIVADIAPLYADDQQITDNTMRLKKKTHFWMTYFAYES